MPHSPPLSGFHAEIERRFGVLPNFFRSADAADGVIENLWAFAQSAYLDNPLPPLFKERLFVHLSRLCPVRYCIVRHVGFLVGNGRPAGDAGAEPLTVKQAIRMLRRPMPDAAALDDSFRRMLADPGASDLPQPDTEEEARLFDALTVMFVTPRGSGRAREAVRHVADGRQFELLTAFLAFVRTAHSWTEMHPELEYEADVARLMDEHPDLAALLLDTTDAIESTWSAVERRSAEAALRESEAQSRRDAVWLGAQKEAFQIAMNGGSLADSLGVLARTVTAEAKDGRRCAFYIVDGKREQLTHVVGMPPDYAAAVDGVVVSPESLACGLAVATGKPVVTPDVREEHRWHPWVWLAEQFGYRGCWSFPVETSTGRLVGSLALYFAEPRDAAPEDLELAARITTTAAIVIAHHQENEERLRGEARFRQFADASSDALWIRTAETFAFEYASPAVATVFGVTPEDLIADERTLNSIIVPEERDVVSSRIEKVSDGERIVQEYRILRPTDLAFRWIRSTGFPLRDEQGRINRIASIASDITEAKLAVEHQGVLLKELQHRVRNIMAVIRSIVARTGENAASVEEYSTQMAGRLMTFARVQALLTRSANVGVSLASLVQAELSAQTTNAGQYTMTGPDVTLSPKAAEVLTLAVHELATNAVKYGALTSDKGHIDVRWSVADRNGTPWLQFDWQERGGPRRRSKASSVLGRRGFGSELIEGRIPYELRGEGRLEIGPGGARCHLALPLEDGASILETDAPQRATVFGGALDMRGEADLAGQRILVAEDDYYLAHDAARALRGAGAEVLGPCRSEDGAMEAARTGAPTAAIMDINLGGGPSFRLAEWLREATVPFVFITGYDEDVIPPAFAEVRRLQKPVELKQIVKTVAGIAMPPAAGGPEDRTTGADTLVREQAKSALAAAEAEERPDLVAALRDYAKHLEDDAFAFEQRLTDTSRTAATTNRLATELQEVVKVTRRQMAELKVKGGRPARPAKNSLRAKQQD